MQNFLFIGPGCYMDLCLVVCCHWFAFPVAAARAGSPAYRTHLPLFHPVVPMPVNFCPGCYGPAALLVTFWTFTPLCCRLHPLVHAPSITRVFYLHNSHYGSVYLLPRRVVLCSARLPIGVVPHVTALLYSTVLVYPHVTLHSRYYCLTQMPICCTDTLRVV